MRKKSAGGKEEFFFFFLSAKSDSEAKIGVGWVLNKVIRQGREMKENICLWRQSPKQDAIDTKLDSS